MAPAPYSTVELARRLERAEALGGLRFVEARARVSPAVGATWKEIGGAHALFDGPQSPVTQCFGLGMFQPATPETLAAIEAFFRSRGADVFIELCPLAGVEASELLARRGYVPVEHTSVLYQSLPCGILPPPSDVEARRAHAGELELWTRLAADGWGDFPEYRPFLLEMGRVLSDSEGARMFFAEVSGVPAATGLLRTDGSVALLAGASTVPSSRRRGAQLALLQARLNDAANSGCDVAMMCASPGSASQRNAERQGFRIAYTRTKWRLPAA